MRQPIKRVVPRAFTLIELLVVISIIALLIAILLPALGSARDSSRRTQCLAHQKQMATASIAFATDDPKGRLIPARQDGFDNYVQHAVNLGLVANAWSPGAKDFREYGYPLEIMGDPGRDDFEPFVRYNSYHHGYQYFGGITEWRNLPGTPNRVRGLSPVSLDQMNSEQTFIADSTVRPNRSWNWDVASTDPQFAGSPAHGFTGKGADAKPLGGNHVYGDGSGEWVDFSLFEDLHIWSGGRDAWYYQKDLGEYVPPAP